MQRRDFLNGAACLGVAGGWPRAALANGSGYPPGLTGLRGSHPGSMDAAHAVAWASDVAPAEPTGDVEEVDVVVVGAGISGLSAAHFYRQRVKPNARVLILDNHDDFGGHARRNEFMVEGRHVLTYGGTQSFDTPAAYSPVARGFLRELGVDMLALRRAYDLDFFARHRLGMGLYFDRQGFGRDVLWRSSPPTVRPPSYYGRYYVPGLVSSPAFVSQWRGAPMRPEQLAQLQRVLTHTPHGRSTALREADIRQASSYLDFVAKVYQVTDPAVLALLSMTLTEDAALGGFAVSMEAAASGGLLGLGSAAQRARWFADSHEDEEDHAPLPETGDDDDMDGYLFHFPDGGATVARLLVQRLMPGVARFSGAVGCVEARFDYAQLDRPGVQPVNLRLNSTVVSVANAAKGVSLHYVQAGNRRRVSARHAIMAGWSAVNAHVVKGLPTAQKEAMHANIKMPMVYAQVVLRRWHALQSSGMGVVYAPHAPFQFSQMDFPVSMGRYRPPRGPDEPACLLMIRCPGPLLEPGAAPDIFRAGRAELLGQDFAHYVQAILAQLQGMYGPHGLDAQRDVAAITVNRWGHGFVWDEAQYQGQPAHKLSARRLGNIAMAGADSAGKAYLDAAIDAAWRAVNELPRS